MLANWTTYSLYFRALRNIFEEMLFERINLKRFTIINLKLIIFVNKSIY